VCGWLGARAAVVAVRRLKVFDTEHCSLDVLESRIAANWIVRRAYGQEHELRIAFHDRTLERRECLVMLAECAMHLRV
jgi:hypothetical protein